MEKVPMTIYGYSKIEKELRFRVREERPAIIKEIEEARAHGDLSENAEYHAAKEKQALNEGIIADLESKISRAAVVDPLKMKGSKAVLGATVEVVDVDTDKESVYVLVGADEADLDKGLVSITSPIGRALIGKEEGDEASFTAPSGTRTYEVLSVSFKEIEV